MKFKNTNTILTIIYFIVQSTVSFAQHVESNISVIDKSKESPILTKEEIAKYGVQVTPKDLIPPMTPTVFPTNTIPDNIDLKKIEAQIKKEIELIESKKEEKPIKIDNNLSQFNIQSPNKSNKKK